MMQCEHEYENQNCTNCANGLPHSAFECAKTQGRLKEYCHARAEALHDMYYQRGRIRALEEVDNLIKLKFYGVHPDELYEKYYPREIITIIDEIIEQLKKGGN